MKSILFISPQPYFQWRGSPIRVRFVLQAFSELGYQVDLLTLPFGEDTDIPNVNITRVANIYRAKNVPIGPSLMKALFDVLIIIKAIGMLRKKRYDVIHGIEEGGFIALILGKLFGCKTVFEKHSDPSSHKKGLVRNLVLSLYAGMEKFTIRRVNLIIGTGQGLADQANHLNPKGEVRAIFDIPSSLVEATAAQAQKQRDIISQEPGESLACFVGSFAVYQGIDLLFKAIPLVVKKRPKVRFVIIGGNDEEISARRQPLVKLGIDQNVSFLGKISPDDLPLHLKAMDILLAPRHSGVNTPLKVLDYFKAAKPIVATDVPSNRLILSDATAVFADVTPQAYCDKIVQLVDDPIFCKQMGDNGHTLYKEKYNFLSFKSLIEKAYSHLI
jgi:glycosyltransferase involved in cell wall biosynthesis